MPKLLADAVGEKIMRSVGVQKVSKGAAKALSDLLGDFGSEIADFATQIAKKKKRKTVNEDDIKIAVKEMFG